MYLEIFSFILLVLAFRYVPFLQLKNVSRWTMPVVFCVKVAAGIIFLMIYLHNDVHNSLPSDTMKFLAESKTLHDVFYRSPKDYFSLLFGVGDCMELGGIYFKKHTLWHPFGLKPIIDSRSIIRLNSIIYFWSNGSPFIHMLCMCFLSSLGIKQIYLAVCAYTVQRPYMILSSMVFLPSLLFWTSGVLKEPLLFFGLGLFLRSTLGSDSNKKKSIYLLFSVIILLNVKYYVILCVLPSIIFYLVYKYIFNFRIVLSLTVCLLAFIVGVFLFKTISARIVHRITVEQFQFNHVGKGGLYVKDGSNYYYFKQHQYSKIKIDTLNQTVELLHPIKITIYYHRNYYPTKSQYIEPNGEKWKIDYFEKGAVSFIETTPINNSKLQLIKNLPEALINSILRPLPGDPGSSLVFIAMLEVWGVLAFLGIAIYYRRKIDRETKGIVISIFLFAICLFLLTGWTTPVIGAIFRYRFPAELALVLISLVMLRQKKEVAD